MDWSGILVVCAPAHMDAVIRGLRGLAGVEVHHPDRTAGRLIVTQEAASIGASADGLRRIKMLKHVVSAELIYHRFDEPPAQGADTAQVPPYLNA